MMKWKRLEESNEEIDDESEEPETKSTRYKNEKLDPNEFGSLKHHQRFDEPEDSEISESCESEEEGDEVKEKDFSKNLMDQMADVPFETLQRLRSDGRDIFKKKRAKLDLGVQNQPEKNKPLETTTKKQVSRFKEVIRKPIKTPRDPRFNPACGEFDENYFKSAYKFLFDENLPKERMSLLKTLSKEKDVTKKAELQNQLKFIDKQLKNEEKRKSLNEKKKELKENIKSAVKEGKKPFFPKKADLKKEELVEKFKQLRESGKLESFLAKKRKRIATKQHTKIPFRRNVE